MILRDWIKEYAEEHNVTLVPLYTTFDGQTYYKEQFEISYDEFYRKMTDEKQHFLNLLFLLFKIMLMHFMPSVEAGVPIICCLYNNIFSGFIQLSFALQGI